jgi:N utilization substance protein B
LLKKIDRLDKIIGVAAPEWPIAKINKIDLSIMRLAVFELLENKEPTKVVIDEAVELAKQYGSDKSYKFINGALGTIVKNNLLTAKL